MSRRQRFATPLLALLLGGCAFGPWSVGNPAEPLPTGPARIRLELLGGFASEPTPLPSGRVALVVDATASMARATPAGPSRVRGARAAAERFIASLDAERPLDLWITGNARNAGCDDALSPHDGDRATLDRTVGRIRARGRGSLATALAALPGPDAGGYERVVGISALDDGCGGDLCAAAAGLVARGVRLDLVRIGDVPAPDCLSDLVPPQGDTPPVPWSTQRRVAFHVERGAPDPAIVVCGESGGLPVEVAPGAVEMVVKLDPPLRVSRSLPAGTRWTLQVIDFPGLDPPERQWRWQADPAPTRAAGR